MNTDYSTLTANELKEQITNLTVALNSLQRLLVDDPDLDIKTYASLSDQIEEIEGHLWVAQFEEQRRKS